MKSFPTQMIEAPVWLDMSDLSQAGRAPLDSLIEKGFRVQLGITADDIEQLSALSLQQSIRDYCPKDCTERFKDVETARQWLKKGRMFFLLKDGNGTIAGYGWSGPGLNDYVLPDANLTGALRINELFQGKGLATPFLSVLIDYTTKNWPRENLWFEAWKSNAGAVHIYEKLGFIIVNKKPATRLNADQRIVEDVRLLMQLS